MIDIEELSRQLISSQLFKGLLQEQVRQCILAEKLAEKEAEVSVNSLVGQISSYLASITEMALEEENSHNYLTAMNKNKEMYAELDRKIQITLEGKVTELSKQIEELQVHLQKVQKAFKSSPFQSKTQKLRSQRKMIAKSILDTSRVTTKTKSTLNPRLMFKASNSSQLQSSALADSGNTQESEESGISQLPVYSDKENSPTLGDQLKAKIEQTGKDQRRLNQEFVKLGCRLQNKMQMNLQGVWNVLGDVTNRIAKLQLWSDSIGIADS